MAPADQLEVCWAELTQLGLASRVVPVTYINSAASIKALVGENGGTVCTSSNAAATLKWAWAQREKILFLPDQHLGRNTAFKMGVPLDQMVVWDPYEPFGGLTRQQLEAARLILWKGHCSVHGRSRVPYDAFLMSLRFGGGASLSEARLVGRLIGQPLRNPRFQLSVLQSYDFQNNDAYSFGAQSFAGTLGYTQALGSRVDLWIIGSGGLTVLGAIDSLPLGVDEKPVDEGDGSAGQGVSEGPRFYDYGPGSNFSLRTSLSVAKRPVATIFYEGRQVYSLDGVRANHFLQHARLDLLLPLHRQLGIGTTAEYFARHTYYQDEAGTEKLFRFPQFRVYLTWAIS